MTILGTNTVLDTLRVRTQSIANFGVDRAWAAIDAYLNEIRGKNLSILAEIAETTTDARRLWGSTMNGNGEEFMDDIGTPKPVKPLLGSQVDFPLRRFGWTLANSAEFEKVATPDDLRASMIAIQGQYEQRILDEIKHAVFNAVNYSMVDPFDKTTLNVKAFKYAADTVMVPMAPDGTEFATNHEHYKGTSGASLAYGDLDALVTNVREHGYGDINIFMNAADVSTLVGLTTTRFTKLTHSVLAVPGRTSGTVVTDAATEDLNNKLVGYWDDVPVLTRSWVPDNYYVATAMDAAERPLAKRVFPGLEGLVDLGESRNGLVIAKYLYAYFGIAPWNRVAMAVLDGAHQTTYQEPSGLVR